MKFKAKESFHSALGTFEKGKEYELELDAYTIENWVENGLIGLISSPKKGVTKDESK